MPQLKMTHAAILCAALLLAAAAGAAAARASSAFDPGHMWLGEELSHLATGWGRSSAPASAFARQVRRGWCAAVCARAGPHAPGAREGAARLASSFLGRGAYAQR